MIITRVVQYRVDTLPDSQGLIRANYGWNSTRAALVELANLARSMDDVPAFAYADE